jgi:hypothetical protein
MTPLSLLVDRALETAYIVAGLEGSADSGVSVRDGLRGEDVGEADFALIPTPEISLLTATHGADPDFGVSVAESGAIAMRSPVRPDEIEEASILLYETSSTAELLARATIWPFYGIKASAWTIEADGASAITIVDGISALEPVEAGYSEDLVRAWYILTEQSVVTHLLAIPAGASNAEVDAVRSLLTNAAAAGYAARREVRRSLQAESSVEGDRLVAFLAGVRFDLDADDRAAAYSLIARGSGGTRYPLLREIPWRPVGEDGPSL